MLPQVFAPIYAACIIYLTLSEFENWRHLDGFIYPEYTDLKN